VGFALFSKKKLDERTSGYSLSKADAREYLLPNLPSDKVRKVIIQDSKGKVTLAVQGEKWVVEERSGYPATFQKIQRMVQALEEIKIKDRKEVGKSSLARLNVLPPGEQKDAEGAGLEVQLQDEKGAVLGSIVVGSSPKSSGGASSANMFGGPTPQRFVRTPNDKDTVWVVEDSFDEIQADPRLWLDTSWPNISNVKTLEVTFPNAADSWKAERATLDAPFAFVNAPAGEELDTAKAAAISGRVLEGPLNDVLLKDKVTPDTMKGAIKAKIVTFDGFTYDVEILEKPKEGNYESYLVALKVAADIPTVRKPSPDEKEEDVKRKDEEFKKNNEMLTKRFAEEKKFEGWVYEVSQYGVGSLVKKRSELLREKEPVPPAPRAPVPGSLMPPDAPPVPPLGIPGRAAAPANTPPASLAKPEEKPAPAPAPAPAEEKKPTPAAEKPAEGKPAAPAPADKPAADKPAETKAAEEKAPAPVPGPAPADKPAEAPTPAPAPAEKPAEAKSAETQPASS
jgi:hypothetical protein